MSFTIFQTLLKLERIFFHPSVRIIIQSSSQKKFSQNLINNLKVALSLLHIPTVHSKNEFKNFSSNFEVVATTPTT